MNKSEYSVADFLQQNINSFKKTLRTGIVVAFLFTAVNAQAAPVNGYQSCSQSEPQIVVTLPVLSSSAHIEVLNRISTLKANWDGEGAVAPNLDALKNSKRLLALLDDSQLKLLPLSNIYASNYGSIILDFETQRGLVSVEMGDVTMGFYTDFPDGENYATEGISTDFNHVPEILRKYMS